MSIVMKCVQESKKNKSREMDLRSDSADGRTSMAPGAGTVMGPAR